MSILPTSELLDIISKSDVLTVDDLNRARPTIRTHSIKFLKFGLWPISSDLLSRIKSSLNAFLWFHFQSAKNLIWFVFHLIKIFRYFIQAKRSFMTRVDVLLSTSSIDNRFVRDPINAINRIFVTYDQRRNGHNRDCVPDHSVVVTPISTGITIYFKIDGRKRWALYPENRKNFFY